MSITSGFYDAIRNLDNSWDREYTALQFSQIFDGIINDGVYESIGTHFTVSGDSSTNMQVLVGSGRAWFDHTWTLIEGSETVLLSSPHSTYPRIDAIVLETSSVQRENYITKVTGSINGNNPQRPPIADNQHVLAYVRVKSNGGTPYKIDATMIDNMVGIETPFVTGIIEVTDISDLISQYTTMLQAEIDSIDQSSNFDLPPIIGYNIVVQQNQFHTFTASDSEETGIKNLGYDYKATIDTSPLDTVSAGMRPYITWSLPSLNNANADILNQCRCVLGGVDIYASAIPTSSITALTIECRRNSTD